jgi:hypothetical protein
MSAKRDVRICPYCGKEYPDELIFCPVDQRALTDPRVHWDTIPSPKTGNPSGRKRVKMIVASLAFLPMLTLLVEDLTGPGGFSKALITVCVYLNYPAFSILSLIDTFKVSHSFYELTAFGLMTLWSSFMAFALWKIVGTLQGDDEPEATRGQYDWAGFRVRFVIGFVIGFLCGWRFVRNTKSFETLWIASFITGFVGGLIYGLIRPPDFWSRS